ncbi:unnamed protein product, partial [marine sediment metagenome]
NARTHQAKTNIFGHIAATARKSAQYLERFIKHQKNIIDLLRVDPKPLKNIEESLKENEALIAYLPVGAGIYVFIAQQGRIQFVNIPFDHKACRSALAHLCSAPPQSGEYSRAEERVKHMVGLIANSIQIYIADKKYIGLVPFDYLSYLPLEISVGSKSDERQVFYLNNMSSYKYLKSKRKIYKNKFCAVGPLEGFRGAELFKGSRHVPLNSTKGVLGHEEYDIIQFNNTVRLEHAVPVFSTVLTNVDGGSDGREVPRYSMVGEVSGNKSGIRGFDWFNMKQRLYLAVFTGTSFEKECLLGHGPDSFLPIEEALFLQGCPSILVQRFAMPAEIKAELLNLFYQNLKDHNKAVALQRSACSILEKYNSIRYAYAFILKGYPGLSNEEILSEVSSLCQRSERQGRLAYANKNWDDVIYYYNLFLKLAGSTGSIDYI